MGRDGGKCGRGGNDLKEKKEEESGMEMQIENEGAEEGSVPGEKGEGGVSAGVRSGQTE